MRPNCPRYVSRWHETAVRDQLATVRRIALVALVVGLLAALGLSWAASSLLGRRVSAIGRVAQRYAAGDVSQPSRDYGTDEIGTVARVLDDSVREVARRASELESDRARMAAILSGMIEGVLVVNEQGRLLLVNGAARRMLKLQDAAEGRHYLELVRHPEIAAAIGAGAGRHRRRRARADAAGRARHDLHRAHGAGPF